MSQNDPLAVVVKILGREYHVACTEEERQPLIESARYLDSKMSEIRGDRKVIGTDRIAVMAALNIAHELLQCQSTGGSKNGASTQQLADINEKIEMALTRCKHAEEVA